MTVKEAANKFGRNENEIRAIIRDGFLLAHKEKGKYIIPNDTQIIISKTEIQIFLLQIIKYKNNEHYVISRKGCPCFEELKILADYLYINGLIGQINTYKNEDEFFQKAKLTDKGFDLILGTVTKKAKNDIKFSIIPSLNINVGLVNVG